jgi:hypothetical protein
MRLLKYWTLTAAAFLWLLPAEAHINPLLQGKPKPVSKDTPVSFREDCVTPKAQVDQGVNRLTGGKVNNVRARLRTGGDPWWDGNDGKYIVPHVDPGQPEVSSIFAGGVWLGGVDPGGSLKVACQTYGNPSGRTDFWTGPLDPNDGTTDKPICDRWDRFFEVYATEIDEHLRLYNESVAAGTSYDPALIPRGVKGWPAKGNEFFFDINEFDLPNTSQGLAGFFDRDGDTNYEPLDGDYPIIEIRGCDIPTYPDQMIFWIYNDNGGIHAETQGNAIQMEIQVQAFSYGTNDEINDMTFQRYKLINRAIEDIDSTFFAMWVDADLGCFIDDYVGCNVERSLAFVYNSDAEDGDPGTTCQGGVPTYGTDIPIVGVDYFRGPLRPILDDEGNIVEEVELGMSSFTYYNNGGFNNPPPPTTDPNIAIEYYRYLTGSWRDGTPFTFGGDAYNTGDPINYAFTDPPNRIDGWSMCTANLPEYDRRTIQASGPFLLKPGAVNELIIGVVWVPELVYPCPNITRLFVADDLAQNLFDNCFQITDGPDAPDVDFIELDRKIIAVLTNDTLSSNNAFEEYEELDLLAPAIPDIDTTYNFEGYILYQLADNSVIRSDYNNPSKARIVANVDIKNGVAEIFNWTSVPDPGDPEKSVWFPVSQVVGQDQGIRHTFEINEDQFATSDRRLVNHKKYYFSAVAYAYNNWAQFETENAFGQKRSYLEGRRNIKTYTVIPRPIVDRDLNSAYGDGPVVTRLDGVGVGGNFVDISEETRQAILDGSFDGSIIYKGGRSPIEIKVFNPLEVVNGEFQLRFFDENMNNNKLDNDVRWELRNLSDPSQGVIRAEKDISSLNEQIIAKYGFTISIGQTADVGQKADETNGGIGYEEEYEDLTKPLWFSGVPSKFGEGFITNFTNYGPDGLSAVDRALGRIGPGYFVPYQAVRYVPDPNNPYISPALQNSAANAYYSQEALEKTNNIDIVFTPDKSLWSRCVIIETASRLYTNDLGLSTEGDARQFHLRRKASVGKFDGDGDGLPDPDNEKDWQGQDKTGMGWFPGYAIDVETGKRLNIFFGENSAYDCSIFCDGYQDGVSTANDMLFNPTSQILLSTPEVGTTIFNMIGGGQHFIYVSNTEYDQCEAIYRRLKNNGPAITLNQVGLVLLNLAWAGWPVMQPGTRMEPLGAGDTGLIPNELTVKLRVDNPYQVAVGTGDNNGYNAYEFAFENVAPTPLTPQGVESALDMINVVPNPYYAFSAYEVDQFSTVVKITNLPAKCVVTIYSLDGRFIRQYNRDESGAIPVGVNRGVSQAQYAPDVEWDLKNNKGIPIAAGVYLIHIDAGELGERVIKWFGTNRQFDPSGL